jgi:hypothetical protein
MPEPISGEVPITLIGGNTAAGTALVSATLGGGLPS